MDRFGIHDPVRRRCNILAWVRGHYQDRGEDHGELYEALIAEQLRWGASLTRKVTLDREGARRSVKGGGKVYQRGGAKLYQ